MKQLVSIILSSGLILLISLTPFKMYAEDNNIPTSVSELSKTFSKEFCLAIDEGSEPESAGKLAAKEMIRGLIFSPILKEIMSTPKEVLASSTAKAIYKGCGEELNISEQELNDYLIKIASRDRQQQTPKPFKPFGIG